MKKLVKNVMPFAVIMLFAACNSSSNDSTKENAKGSDNAQSVTNKPVLKNENLNTVYQQYAQLTTELTDAKSSEAKSTAANLETSAKNVQGGDVLASAASKIASTDDLEAQRTAYYDISKELESLIKKDGLSSGELYVTYCPMAFDDKGATWISNSTEIRNPYFGKKMMSCGEVKDTLK